jgi:hypothetical protein
MELSMTDNQLKRMAQAAEVIRRVVGAEFRWETAEMRPHGKGAVMLLLHDSCDPLAPYCNYDLRQYDKIEALASALNEIGLMVEDCDGTYSGVYEVTG